MWPKSNQFWRWSGYVSMQNFRLFPPCVLREMPGNLLGRTDGQTDGQTDGHAVKRSRLVGWPNGPMYRWLEGISGFGRTEGRTTRKHNASGDYRRRHKKQTALMSGSQLRNSVVITMMSYWARWNLKSPASPLFTQSFVPAENKENIKALRHWPLRGDFTGEFPAQMASDAENVSIWWRHHGP